MHRSVLFAATIALSLATAVGMFAAAMVLEPPPLPAHTTDRAEVVHRFYDAINAVLRTGNQAALEAIVAPHFTMHGAFATVSRDRAGLARQLVATSAVAPDLRLEVEDLAVADDRALVHLAQTSGSGGAFLGVPFAATPDFWGRFDALRIDGDRVSELWTGEEPVPLLESLGQSRLDPLLSPNHAMTFRQLSAEAGHAWTWTSTFQSRVLYLEVGALLVEVDPASVAPVVIFAGGGRDQGRSVLPGERARLGAGEALALSPVARYRLSGDPTKAELRAYEVAFPRFAYMGPLGPGLANSTAVGTPAPTTLPTRQPLAEAAQTGLPHDVLIASFGRITLPPGRALALGEAPGPVVLSIEAGTLGIDRPQADSVPVTTRLVSGEATIIPVGEVTTLHAIGAEPVVVFAVTIVPAHAGTRVVPTSHSTLSGT
jgi:SnoaL-like polyketide cyclase